MVDSELRVCLGRDMRRLITGRISSDDFSEAFYFRYAATRDQGVREIANLCSSLYTRQQSPSKRQLHPLVNQVDRGLIARSILFLESELEYQWPGDSISPGHRTIVGFTVFLMLPVLMAILLFWLPVPLAISEEFTTPLALVGILGMLGALCLICFQPPKSKVKLEEKYQQGEKEVWPFLRHHDLNQVASRCYVAACLDGQKI